MIEVKLKIGGSIFIELLNDQEEPERIKIFDSKKQYLEYIPLERIVNIVGDDEVDILMWLAATCKEFAYAEDIHQLLKLADVESYTASKDWTDLIEDAIVFSDEESKENAYAMSMDEFLETEYINIIGDYYILQTGF